MTNLRRILVAGATGKQGGALIRSLTPSTTSPIPFELIALTRDAASPSATRLKQQSNVKLLQGDLNDIPSIFKQAEARFGPNPFYGVFSVQTPLKPKREEAQGKALVDHAIRRGVAHFVYTSADRGGAKSDNDSTVVPHFASKFNIEVHLKRVARESESDMKWTIIRPVAFMENMSPDFFGKIFGNLLKFHGEDHKMQLVSTESVGILAAKAFENPSQFAGRSMSLATDSLSWNEVKAVFKRKAGIDMPMTYDFVANVIINYLAWKELGIMAKWIREEGFGADVNEWRSQYPQMMNFEEWLDRSSKFKKQQMEGRNVLKESGSGA